MGQQIELWSISLISYPSQYLASHIFDNWHYLRNVVWPVINQWLNPNKESQSATCLKLWWWQSTRVGDIIEIDIFFASFSNQWHQRWSLILAKTKHFWPFRKKYTLILLLCPFKEWSKAKWKKTCFVVESYLLNFLLQYPPDFLATLVALHFTPVSEWVSGQFRTSVA